MKIKRIPAIVMLLGGAVACVVTYINDYNLEEMLVVLMISLIVFLVFGVVIRLVFESFQMPEEPKVDDEGEVIEKQGEGNDENEEMLEEEETAEYENQ